MTKLAATTVQAMLGVADFENLAHGYSLARETLDLHFENGKFVRVFSHGDEETRREESEYFEADYLLCKRWYENSVNPKLAQLMLTFGNPMNTTPGGKKYGNW